MTGGEFSLVCLKALDSTASITQKSHTGNCYLNDACAGFWEVILCLRSISPPPPLLYGGSVKGNLSGLFWFYVEANKHFVGFFFFFCQSRCQRREGSYSQLAAQEPALELVWTSLSFSEESPQESSLLHPSPHPLPPLPSLSSWSPLHALCSLHPLLTLHPLCPRCPLLRCPHCPTACTLDFGLLCLSTPAQVPDFMVHRAGVSRSVAWGERASSQETESQQSQGSVWHCLCYLEAENWARASVLAGRDVRLHQVLSNAEEEEDTAVWFHRSEW